MTNVMFAAFRDELEKISFVKKASLMQAVGDTFKGGMGASRSAFKAVQQAKTPLSRVLPTTIGTPPAARPALGAVRRTLNAPTTSSRIPNLGANRGKVGENLRLGQGRGVAPTPNMAMAAG